MANYGSFWGKSPRNVRGVFYKALPFFFVICLAALFATGCKDNSDDFVDDGKLNSGLIATWRVSGTYEENGQTMTWYDEYDITSSTIKHDDGGTFNSYNAKIEYVYNFSGNAGCIIIQRENNKKFSALYFRELTSNSVKLGDAINADYSYPLFDTLEEAKTEFVPGNSGKYGGDLSGASSMQRQ